MVLFHDLVLAQLEKLVSAVEQENTGAAAGRQQARAGPNTKLLGHLLDIFFSNVPSDPTSRAYRHGNTLGEDYRHWRRAKTGNGRYRVFFRYSLAQRVIIFAWVNDEQTLRTRGSATDAYTVFAGMLDDGNPPDDWNALLRATSTSKVRARSARVLERARPSEED